MTHVTRIPGIWFEDDPPRLVDMRSWTTKQLGPAAAMTDRDFFIECVETYCDWTLEEWREWAREVYRSH
jgi:hypothetical protein